MTIIKSQRDAILHPAMWLLLATLLTMAMGCAGHEASEVPPDDEAMLRARFESKKPEEAAYDYFYPQKIVDYFPGMDVASRPDVPDQLRKPQEPITPSPQAKPDEFAEQETLGRNTWMIWCAGNESFWDWLCNNSVGLTDFIKSG